MFNIKFNQTPVLGYDKEIIGYWHEKKNKFIPKNGGITLLKLVKDHIYDHMKTSSYVNAPFKIQIGKKKVDGCYHTFRSFGPSDERTIIHSNPDERTIIHSNNEKSNKN